MGIERTEEAVCNSVGEAASLFFQNIGQVEFFPGFLELCWTGASTSAHKFPGGFLVQAQIFGRLLLQKPTNTDKIAWLIRCRGWGVFQRLDPRWQKRQMLAVLRRNQQDQGEGQILPKAL